VSVTLETTLKAPPTVVVTTLVEPLAIPVKPSKGP